ERPWPAFPRLRFSPSLENHVVALGLVLDLVGETALAPEVDMAALGALRLDQLEPPFDSSPDRLLIQLRVDDDHHCVRTRHAPVPPSDHSSGCGPLAHRQAGGFGAGHRL